MKSRIVLSKLLQIVVFGTFLSTVSLADDFDTQDGNQDGVLSGKELEGLKSLDSDQDGEVHRQEFMAAVKAQHQRAETMVAAIFKERDGNEDGRLSGKEISGFEESDSNGDGRIMEAELLVRFTSRDGELKGKSFKQIRQIAESRFEKIDITEDGRLSGTEAYGSTHFDQNGDSRISKEEFVTGLILSVPDTEADTKIDTLPKGGVDKILSDVVSAMNNADKTNNVYQRMHEKMREITDPVVLEYIFKHALKSHASFKIVDKKDIKQTKLKNGGMEASVTLQCGQGELTLSVTTLNDQIVGLALVSPEMNEIDQALFGDLQEEELQKAFVAAYEAEIQQALKAIVDGEDDLAIQMIHPIVVQQLGEEAFKNLFSKMRTHIPKIEGVELETFSNDRSEKGLYTFTITYLVTTGTNAVRFGCTFERAGLCNAMTGYSMELVQEPVTPEPSSDDDPLPSPEIPMAPSLSPDWIETVSIRDGVKFELPGDSTRTEKPVKTGKSINFSHALQSKRMFFNLDVNTLESDFTSESAIFFETFRNALLNGNENELLKEDLDPKAQFPNQLLLLKNKNGTFTVIRTIIAGKKIYRARWSGHDIDEEAKTLAKRFIESIIVIDAGGAPRVGPLEDVPPPPALPVDPELPVAPAAPVAPAPPPAPVSPPGM